MNVPMILPEIEAAILAGGQSRRMGKAKLFLDFRGNSFIAHLLLQLQQQVNNVMIAGAPDPELLADLAVPVLEDSSKDCGPLAGIAAALAATRRQWLLLVPCDNPVLPANYAIRLLHEARQQHAPLVYVRKQGKEQPLYALIRQDLLANLEEYLEHGQRKVMPWYESVGALAVDWDDAGLAFTNLNTPEEYEAFLQIAASVP